MADKGKDKVEEYDPDAAPNRAAYLAWKKKQRPLPDGKKAPK